MRARFSPGEAYAYAALMLQTYLLYIHTYIHTCRYYLVQRERESQGSKVMDARSKEEAEERKPGKRGREGSKERGRWERQREIGERENREREREREGK